LNPLAFIRRHSFGFGGTKQNGYTQHLKDVANSTSEEFNESENPLEPMPE
jgi:hypothetical protein